jgi:hypothetical protein
MVTICYIKRLWVLGWLQGFFLMATVFFSPTAFGQTSSISLNLDPRNIAGAQPDYLTVFTEGKGPVNVTAPDAVVTDSSGEGLTSLVIAVVNVRINDQMEAYTANTNINARYQDGVMTLTSRNIGGRDTAENYQKVLRTVTFDNPSQNVETEDREIRFTPYQEQEKGESAACTLQVAAVNNPPVITAPSSASTPENVPLIFSPALGRRMSISDPDSADGEMEAVLMVDFGLLSANPSSGASIEGNLSSYLTLRGQRSDINASLDGLRYDPPPNRLGEALLQIKVNDGGHTGSPGPLEAFHTLTITIFTLNKAPTANAGFDQLAMETIRVELNGGKSFSPEGKSLHYAWKQISGTPVALNGAETVTPWFMAPNIDVTDETLLFRLTVTDSNGSQDEDEVSVKILNFVTSEEGDGDGSGGSCFIGTFYSWGTTLP